MDDRGENIANRDGLEAAAGSGHGVRQGTAAGAASAPDAATQDASKTLYIVKGKREALRGAEAYLRNRGWKVESSVEMRDAISELISLKPAFVLVCVDATSAPPRALPRLIRQAVGAKLMLYVEGNATAMTAFSQEIGCSYMLFPPVSGPAIERLVWRIQRDERKRVEGDDPARATRGRAAAGDDGGAISVRGGSSGGQDGERETSVRSGDGAREALTALTRASADGGDASSASPSSSVPDARVIDGHAPASGAAASGGQMASPARLAADGAGAGQLAFAQQNGIDAKSGAPPPGATGPDEALAARLRALSEGPKAPLFEQESANASRGKNPKKEPAARGRTPRPTGREGRGWARLSESSESIFVTGTDAALSLATRPAVEPKPERVKAVTRIGCIEVASQRFSGYLLVAWGADRPLDDALLRAMRTRLVEFMRARGEEFDADEAMRLSLREVTFEAWAIEQAEFMRRSAHDGHEIAVAFFPNRADEIAFEPSGRADMVHISLEDLRGDARVEFDLYLHLPKNDKYILYTPEGKRFYQKQKDKLRAKGVKRMHMKKEAAVDLRRYRIQNFLNDRIAECAAAPSAAA